MKRNVIFKSLNISSMIVESSPAETTIYFIYFYLTLLIYNCLIAFLYCNAAK